MTDKFDREREEGSRPYRAPFSKILPAFAPVSFGSGVVEYLRDPLLVPGERRLIESEARSLVVACAYVGIDVAAAEKHFDSDRVLAALTDSVSNLDIMTAEEKRRALKLVQCFYDYRIIRGEHSSDDWLCEALWSEFQTVPYAYPSAMAHLVDYALGFVGNILDQSTLEYDQVVERGDDAPPELPILTPLSQADEAWRQLEIFETKHLSEEHDGVLPEELQHTVELLKALRALEQWLLAEQREQWETMEEYFKSAQEKIGKSSEYVATRNAEHFENGSLGFRLETALRTTKHWRDILHAGTKPAFPKLDFAKVATAGGVTDLRDNIEGLLVVAYCARGLDSHETTREDCADK